MSLAGVQPATIRYYERRGVLSRPQRTPSSYRTYPAEAGLQLRLIRWAKGVGFTLREIRDLLQVVREHAQRPTDRVRGRFDAKLHEVELRMQDLAAMRDQLAALAACRRQAGDRLPAPCPGQGSTQAPTGAPGAHAPQRPG